MKVALSGSSGVGKTTLARQLAAENIFSGATIDNFVGLDTQSLLGILGFKDFESMDMEERRQFRIEFLKLKLKSEEFQTNYVTDRSFVDIAAYWIVTDDGESSVLHEEVMNSCRKGAERYDIHFVFPNKPFNGTRSEYGVKQESLHSEFDRVLRALILNWSLKVEYFTIDNSSYFEQARVWNQQDLDHTHICQ